MPAHKIPIEERLWGRMSKSEEDDGCWLWVGGHRDREGYGIVKLDGLNQRAHRVAWKLAHGLIPPGLCVLHRCDNPPCIRPDHLFVGTVGDNNRDRSRKGRTNVPRGTAQRVAKLIEADVREIRRLRAAGWTHERIAGRFPISRSQVGAIVSGKSWAHVG
jgi:hypothetical protein